MQMKYYVEKCLAGEELSVEEASSALELIMTNQATDAQVAGLLIALRAKGETVGEIVGFARTMREKSVRITVDDPDAVDIVGTGCDGAGTFNISTVASFVCSGAGVLSPNTGTGPFQAEAAVPMSFPHSEPILNCLPKRWSAVSTLSG